MKIKSNTSILKLHYFIHGAGASPINPYITIIIKQLGMNVATMGPVLLFIQILGLIFKPIFGILMDRSHKKTLVFQIAIAGTLLYYGFNILPKNGTFEEVFNLNVECGDSHNLKAIVTESKVPDLCLKHRFNSLYRDTSVHCDFHCTDSKFSDFRFKGSFVGSKVDMINRGHLRIFLDHRLDHPCNSQLKCSTRCPQFPEVEKVMNSYLNGMRYYFIVFIWIVGHVSFSIVNSVQDAVCQKICRNSVNAEKKEENKVYYGQQRTWNSIGWGISALLMGKLMDIYNQDKLLFDYSPVFNSMLILWTLDIIVIGFLQIPDDARDNAKSYNNIRNVNQLKAVYTLITTNQSVISFLLYVTFVGFCYGAMHIHFIFLEDLGQRNDCNGFIAMKTLQGIVLLFHTLGEFPVFLLSHKVEEKIGCKGMMSVVLLTFSVRFLYYSSIESPWSILFIELSNGLTTGLFWPAISSYAVSLAPTNASATMLTVTYAVFEACGVGIGSLVATKLYADLGGRMVFTIYGIFAFFIFLSHGIVQIYMNKVESNELKNKTKDNTYTTLL
ncbi:major facilitator superfamily domain-containing protein 6 isoform X1 [Lepeophtheirus salmonis]|uniref:major facilitator superfamily domain-containing protein 6 isoform X1 n=2 Tax=Lepeophtheirus salmonis TaxID=72036 RepID=UPI001AE1A860|nr:major facilitator superfamily domain-containing protein 6-like isoform X1 [Lepeophtheirus salmonis]